MEGGDKVEPLQPAAVVLTAWFRVGQAVKNQIVECEVEVQRQHLRRLVHVKARILAFLYLVQDKNERDWAKKVEEKAKAAFEEFEKKKAEKIDRETAQSD